MLHGQSTGFDSRLHVMSHTFPQLIQTAAVVVVEISMTDPAYDVVPV